MSFLLFAKIPSSFSSKHHITTFILFSSELCCFTINVLPCNNLVYIYYCLHTVLLYCLYLCINGGCWKLNFSCSLREIITGAYDSVRDGNVLNSSAIVCMIHESFTVRIGTHLDPTEWSRFWAGTGHSECPGNLLYTCRTKREWHIRNHFSDWRKTCRFFSALLMTQKMWKLFWENSWSQTLFMSTIQNNQETF